MTGFRYFELLAISLWPPLATALPDSKRDDDTQIELGVTLDEIVLRAIRRNASASSCRNRPVIFDAGCGRLPIV